MRLFFALWPDAGTRDALAASAHALRATCGGRAPPAANLHLTLAFLGAVAERRVAEFAALAAALPATPFEFVLDQFGYWRAQRLLWAGMRVCPPELGALALALRERLTAAGFQVERRPFHPHVTLLRDVTRAPATEQTPDVPLQWRARHFVLACSLPVRGGVVYRMVGTWPLALPRGGL